MVDYLKITYGWWSGRNFQPSCKALQVEYREQRWTNLLYAHALLVGPYDFGEFDYEMKKQGRKQNFHQVLYLTKNTECF